MEQTGKEWAAGDPLGDAQVVASLAIWALYGQVAVPMRLPDAGRLPRNIFHPVQIGCELACSQQLYSVTIALAA